MLAVMLTTQRRMCAYLSRTNCSRRVEYRRSTCVPASLRSPSVIAPRVSRCSVSPLYSSFSHLPRRSTGASRTEERARAHSPFPLSSFPSRLPSHTPTHPYARLSRESYAAPCSIMLPLFFRPTSWSQENANGTSACD